jgi:lysylphosphatidylglycerol synthetase-like protein (DUF2156 family)
MEHIIKGFLLLHVLSGFTALSTGVLALVVRKGKKAHRQLGQIFVLAMLFVALTAIVVSLYKGQNFLLMIALFAFFQTYFGYRATKNKKMQANLWDWSVLILAATNGFFMVYSLEIVLLVFGGINLLLVWGQTHLFLKVRKGEKLPQGSWLRQHIGMMMGAFIATVTAFGLVNFSHIQPNWIPWLAPTLVLVPLIFYFQKKFAPVREV